MVRLPEGIAHLFQRKADYPVHNFHRDNNPFFRIMRESDVEQEPYCNAAIENWEEIGLHLQQNPEQAVGEYIEIPPVSICVGTHKPPYYQEKFTAKVLVKKTGLETGITVSPEGETYLTSGVYLGRGKNFVLMVRKVSLVHGPREAILKKLQG